MNICSYCSVTWRNNTQHMNLIKSCQICIDMEKLVNERIMLEMENHELRLLLLENGIDPEKRKKNEI